MKRISIILSLFLSAILTGCTGLLQEHPMSTYTKDNAVVDEAGLKAVLVGAYSGVINLYVINTNTPIFLSMIGTDELCYRADNTNIRSTIDRYTFTPTEGCIGELWARYYAIIAGTNVVIDASQRLTSVSETVRLQCEGEARFLRAWSYFQLVQFFGDLPVMDKLLTEFDYTVPRSPLKDVYSLIVSDLEFASGDGVLGSEIKDGHASHWAAKTLLAKVYLTMASAKSAAKVAGYALIPESVNELYRKSYDILDEIIKNSGRTLLPKYSDVFAVDNKNKNSESIWELQFSGQEPYGTQWPKEMGLTNTGYSGTAGGWRYCALGGQYTLNSVPSLRGYYRSWTQDVRKNWNICDSLLTYDKTTGAPLSIRHIYGLSGISNNSDLTNNSNSSLVTRSSATKFRWGKSWKNDYPISYNYSNCPNNIIALRFADVLLMFTEADMALNGGVATSEGLDAINLVVQRARGLDASGVPVPASATPDLPDYTSATLDMEALMKERACELCFEFWRRHDLARTGMFEHFLAARNAASNLKTNFDPAKNYLLPVPQYEIDNSRNPKGMYQNPGYSNDDTEKK